MTNELHLDKGTPTVRPPEKGAGVVVLNETVADIKPLTEAADTVDVRALYDGLHERLTALEELLQAQTWTQRLNAQYNLYGDLRQRINEFAYKTNERLDRVEEQAKMNRDVIELNRKRLDEYAPLDWQSHNTLQAQVNVLRAWKQSADEKLRDVFIRADEANERLDAILGEDVGDWPMSEEFDVKAMVIELGRSYDELKSRVDVAVTAIAHLEKQADPHITWTDSRGREAAEYWRQETIKAREEVARLRDELESNDE